MENSEKVTCGGFETSKICEFAHRVENDGKEFFECRRYPPSVQPMPYEHPLTHERGINLVPLHPTLPAHHWCGEAK